MNRSSSDVLQSILQVFINAFPNATIEIDYPSTPECTITIKAFVGSPFEEWVEIALKIRDDLDGAVLVITKHSVKYPPEGIPVLEDPMSTPADIIGSLSWYSGELPETGPFWIPSEVEKLPNLAYIDRHLMFSGHQYNQHDILTQVGESKWVARWTGAGEIESEYHVTLLRPGDPNNPIASIDRYRPIPEDYVAVNDIAESLEIVEVIEERAHGIIKTLGLPGPTKVKMKVSDTQTTNVNELEGAWISDDEIDQILAAL